MKGMMINRRFWTGHHLQLKEMGKWIPLAPIPSAAKRIRSTRIRGNWRTEELLKQKRRYLYLTAANATAGIQQFSSALISINVSFVLRRWFHGLLQKQQQEQQQKPMLRSPPEPGSHVARIGVPEEICLSSLISPTKTQTWKNALSVPTIPHKYPLTRTVFKYFHKYCWSYWFWTVHRNLWYLPSRYMYRTPFPSHLPCLRVHCRNLFLVHCLRAIIILLLTFRLPGGYGTHPL